MKILLFGNNFAPELTGIGKYTGAWRDEAFRVTQLPWQVSKVAHFVVFAGLACVARLNLLRF
jgi:hypothetical protein